MFILNIADNFLQNILIFSETFIFQALALTLPLSSFLPERTIVDFIAVCSLVGKMLVSSAGALHHESHYWHDALADYIEGLGEPQNASTPKLAKNIVLTGHSLGGTVAQLVGSKLRLASVAFASPGITLMHKKFGISVDAIDAYSSNIIASNDVIARIDKLGGAVHHVLCEHQRGDVCHSIELHTIRMWTMCPTYRRVVHVNGTYVVRPQPHTAFVNKIQEWVKELL